MSKAMGRVNYKFKRELENLFSGDRAMLADQKKQCRRLSLASFRCLRKASTW